MKRNEQRLAHGFRNLVEAEELPPPPMADWLALVRPAPSDTADRPPEARWPEELAFKPPAGLVSTAATVALAASLALVQASGWVNPIDRGANRLLAQPAVQSGLAAAWDLARTGQLPEQGETK